MGNWSVLSVVGRHTDLAVRPLFVVTNGEPEGDAKVFIDFLLSPRGQALVRKHGYLSLDQLK